MDQLEDEDDVRDLSSDDEDEDQQDHLAEMEDDDDDEGDDVEKVNDLDFIAQHAAEPFVFSSDVSKAVIATTGSMSNDEEVEMNQSDDESEQELDPVVMSDNDTSSDDESDILEMERKTTTKDTYTSHKTEAASWLTEEEESMPSGPPRTRNEVDENYDVFDPNEFDLAGTISPIPNIPPITVLLSLPLSHTLSFPHLSHIIPTPITPPFTHITSNTPPFTSLLSLLPFTSLLPIHTPSYNHTLDTSTLYFFMIRYKQHPWSILLVVGHGWQ